MLHLQTVDYTNNAARREKLARRERVKHMGLKEKKRQKQLDALERELRQTEATERQQDRLKIVGFALLQNSCSTR